MSVLLNNKLTESVTEALKPGSFYWIKKHGVLLHFSSTKVGPMQAHQKVRLSEVFDSSSDYHYALAVVAADSPHTTNWDEGVLLHALLAAVTIKDFEEVDVEITMTKKK